MAHRGQGCDAEPRCRGLRDRGPAAPRPHFVDASMERPSVSGVAGSYAATAARGLAPKLVNARGPLLEGRSPGSTVAALLCLQRCASRGRSPCVCGAWPAGMNGCHKTELPAEGLSIGGTPDRARRQMMLPEVLEDMLQHVPTMNLQFDGDCAQASGIDLPVVVINLPHRTDRWQTLSRRMTAVGLTKLIRASAVEGSRLSDGQIAALLRSRADGIDEAPRSHLTLTRPAIGCFLSHLAIWRWVLGTSLPRVLVLEDDAAPAAHYSPARFCSVVASIPEEAGLVFLGRMIMGGLADRPEGSQLARIYYFNGTFAYLITPAACQSCSGASCRCTRISIIRSAGS